MLSAIKNEQAQKDANKLLENRQLEVEQRTALLEQRNTTIQTIIESAKLANQARTEGRIIEQTIHLVADRLALDHIGIFLLNDTGEFAVLKAATSHEARSLLENEYRLTVIRNETAYLYSIAEMLRFQVGEQKYYLSRPLQLSDTKTSFSFPLATGQNLIGIMNIQTVSADPQYLDQQAMQTFADQIALSIANVRLVTELQTRVKEVEQLAGRNVQSTWENIRAGGTLGFRYDRLQVLPTTESFPAETNRFLLAGKSASYVTSGIKPRMRLVAPISLRGNVIGVIGYENNDALYKWSNDEVTLLEAIAARVSLALDNTRLVSEAQQRAERERILGQAAARMRESLDIDTVLQISAREVQKALNLKEAEIRIGLPEPMETIVGQPPVRKKRVGE
jgi:GAF domain-containing protein